MSDRRPPTPTPPATGATNGRHAPPVVPPGVAPMEIRLDRSQRVKGLVAYGLFTAAVGGVLVWVFVRFTASVGVAVGLVGFMLAYMYGTAALASRDSRGGRDADPDRGG